MSKVLTKTSYSLATAVAKCALFIIIWILLTLLVDDYRAPSKKAVTDRFYICVLDSNPKSIPSAQPTADTEKARFLPTKVLISERNKRELCHQEYDNFAMDSAGYRATTLTLIEHDYGHSEWELKQENDSFATPFIYRYQIENDMVIPLWWASGGLANSLLKAFFLTLMLFSIWMLSASFRRSNSKIATKNANIKPETDK